MSRRTFLQQAGTAAGGVLLGSLSAARGAAAAPPAYHGPRVILVRFGGGVRRRETIDPQHTYSPYFLKQLVPRGVFFPRMEMSASPACVTSHGEGTLYLLTGKYAKYRDVGHRFLGARYEAEVPTLFEYFRKAFDVPEHQTLLINGEDRPDEEFYTFSRHQAYGIDYRSSVLSLYRFKCWLIREQLAGGRLTEAERLAKEAALKQLEGMDYRANPRSGSCPEIEQFWSSWRSFYGESGLVNPRGDALLTELALRALRELRPRLMMINYQDPDYVHWGNVAHYTRGIAVIDQGLQALVREVERLPEYRDNTLFAVVPDCGRDTNPFAAVPCQHHFGSRSAREIFALFFGKGIRPGQVVDRVVDQVSVTRTLAALMGYPAQEAEGPALEEVLG